MNKVNPEPKAGEPTEIAPKNGNPPPKEQQKDGKKSSTSKKPTIKNWPFYLLWINSYMLGNFHSGLCIIILSFTFPTIKNPNNMNWNDEEGDRYISMMVSAGNFAIVVTGIFFPLLKNKSPKKVAIVAKFTLLASVIATTYPNIVTMILSRLVTGASVSILLSVGNSNAYLVSHPKHRNRAMIIFSLYFAFAFGLTSLLSSFDDGGTLRWRLLFYLQAVIVTLDILSEVTFLRNTNTPFYIIKHQGTAKITQLLEIIFQPEDAKKVAMEHTRSLEKEKQAGGMGIRETIKLYNREFILTIMIGMSKTLSLYSIFYSYSTIWLTSDVDNESEVSIAKIFILLMAVVQASFKVVNTVFNFIKKRRFGLMFAHVLNIFSWVLVWISYVSENLIYVRIGSLVLSLAIGGILSPIHFAYLAEIAPPALISFGFTSSELVTLFANFLSPYFFGDASPRENFVYGVPILMLIMVANLVMIWVFFIESYGLEKSQIYKKLRGLEYEMDGDKKGKGGDSGAEKGDESGKSGKEATGFEAAVQSESRPLVDVVEPVGGEKGEEGVDQEKKLEDIKNMVLGGGSETG